MDKGCWEVRIAASGALLADRAQMADSWTARMVGLLSRSALRKGEGLIFPGCASIHTIGMRFVIDAVFVDKRWQTVAVKHRLGIGRIVLPVPGAWGVIEVPEGTAAKVGLMIGDGLSLSTNNDACASS